MTRGLFPDNTVLCNFAAVDRLDLLEGWLRGRGRWTQAVAFEAGRSAQFLPAMRREHLVAWLGEPIEVDDDQVEPVRRFAFGGKVNEPLKHLGEAETCILITNHPDYQQSWWLSDDADAVEYARGRGIATYETIDIFQALVADGDITAEHAFDLMKLMDNRERNLRLPSSPKDLL